MAGRRACVPLVALLLLLAGASAAEEAADMHALLHDLDTRSVSKVQGERPQPEVKRFWGVPDTTAAAGHVLAYTIPEDAFSGDVDHFEVTEAGEASLPRWLHFDPHSHTFRGVPTEEDVGQLYVSVKAVGTKESASGKTTIAKDVFSIEVVDEPTEVSPTSLRGSQQLKCQPGEFVTLASAILDANIDDLSPLDRVDVLAKMASVIRAEMSAVKLVPLAVGRSAFDSSAFLAGPGNVKARRKSGVVLEWAVGCSGAITPDHSQQLLKLENLAQDGSLADTLGYPVVGWHVTGVQPHLTRREKRQLPHNLRGTPVPGVLPTYWPHLTEKVDEVEPTEESTPDVRIIPTMASPVFSQPSASHHHRHHHGEDPLRRGHFFRSAEISASPTVLHHRLPTSPVYGTPMPTPVLVPERPTALVSSLLGPSRSFVEETTPLDSLLPSMLESVTEYPVSRAYAATSDILTAEVRPTKSRVVVEPTRRPSKIPNFRPTITNRLKKLSMLTGKIWQYYIPHDTFVDLEDGDTKSLKLMFMTADKTSIPSGSWIQFDPEKQMLYALPLEDDIGKHEFILEAMDSEGASISDRIEIHVWQHPEAIRVNHVFTMTLKYTKWQFPVGIDWQIEVMRKLTRFYGDKDTSSVTVRAVTMDPVAISWTNDSLPHTPCPEEEVAKLLGRLTNANGQPTRQLRKTMADEFKIMDVSVEYFRQCAYLMPTTTPSVPPNFPPMLRNPIHHINITSGNILKFKIPDDMFYDFEDGSTRNLQLTFLTADQIQPPKTSWIQFDPRNQELYGLPSPGDAGTHDFLLTAIDMDGYSVSNNLTVVVAAPPSKPWPVEFSFHLDYDFDEFTRDVNKKVLMALKLARLYGDDGPRFVTVNSVTKGSVVYAWTNNTLSPHTCQKHKINQLIKTLVSEDGTISTGLAEVMEPEFKVTQADVMPMGVCLGELSETSASATTTSTTTTTTVPPPPPTTTTVETVPAQEPTTSTTSTSDDDIYITTIIPAVVIAVMLIIAAMVACFLYRKKRKGKLTMHDNTLVSKGVPIIFADELEDTKPDPAKPPVIMKDEKPPLSSGDHRRSASAGRDGTPQTTPKQPLGKRDRVRDQRERDANSSPPYQPPPPFTTSRDVKSTRPKATPSYRQPPPYVPP